MTARAWRGVIALEGVESVDGRVIQPGALTWSHAPWPLRDADGASVGVVTDIERRGSKIHASGLLLSDAPDIERRVPAAMSVDDAEMILDDSLTVMTVTAARFRVVSVGLASAWPECYIEAVS